MAQYDQIKPGQQFALNKLLGQYTQDRSARLFVLSRLLDRDVSSSSDLTQREWARIRDLAYDNWPDDDWTTSRVFGALVAGYLKEYMEQVLGQQRLL